MGQLACIFTVPDIYISLKSRKRGRREEACRSCTNFVVGRRVRRREMNPVSKRRDSHWNE